MLCLTNLFRTFRRLRLCSCCILPTDSTPLRLILETLPGVTCPLALMAPMLPATWRSTLFPRNGLEVACVSQDYRLASRSLSFPDVICLTCLMTPRLVGMSHLTRTTRAECGKSGLSPRFHCTQRRLVFYRVLYTNVSTDADPS